MRIHCQGIVVNKIPDSPLREPEKEPAVVLWFLFPKKTNGPLAVTPVPTTSVVALLGDKAKPWPPSVTGVADGVTPGGKGAHFRSSMVVFSGGRSDVVVLV